VKVGCVAPASSFEPLELELDELELAPDEELELAPDEELELAPDEELELAPEVVVVSSSEQATRPTTVKRESKQPKRRSTFGFMPPL